MYTDQIIPAIVGRYETFTRVERTIADYLINNKVNGDFSIRAMKERLYVSEASLSRFAKKLGYPGYREFVYQYQRIFDSSAPMSVSSGTVLSRYDDILQRFRSVDEGQLDRVVKMIGKARRVLIVGIGSSGLAAEEMKRRLVRLGAPAESCDQRDIMKMQGIFQTEQDLVIGISLSGTKEEVLFTLKQSHQNGAKTVFITGNRTVHDYVDELLLAPTLKNLDGGNIISPQFPVLVMIDLLYNSYLHLNRSKYQLYQETMRALGSPET